MNKFKKVCSRVPIALRKIDVFAKPLTVHYGDHDGHYTTGFGGCMSLLMYSFLAVCAVAQFDRMVNNKRP